MSTRRIATLVALLPAVLAASGCAARTHGQAPAAQQSTSASNPVAAADATDASAELDAIDQDLSTLDTLLAESQTDINATEGDPTQ